MRRWPAALAALALLALTAQTAVAASCPEGFACSTLRVPLDRAGVVPGHIGLHYAIARHGGPGAILAFTGGPGAPSMDSTDLLDPLNSSEERLVLLDLRGTGRSGALDCPAAQRATGYVAISAAATVACARHLGAARAFYTTTDVVADIEALRRHLKVRRISLYGASYGTRVATQYARGHPSHVRRMILDGNVPATSPLRVEEAEYIAAPAVLRRWCVPASHCGARLGDLPTQLHELAQRLADTPLKGTVVGDDGRRRTERVDETALDGMLFAGDYDEYMRAALPGAVRAALDGDSTPLLRLKRPAAGAVTSAADFSNGLFLATTCTDAPALDPALTPQQRAPLLQVQHDALPPEATSIFSARVVEGASDEDQCLPWPATLAALPLDGPLPDVPVLVLDGDADLRTPVEIARRTAALFPHARTVYLAGTGHVILASDFSGCVEREVRTWLRRGRTTGACRKVSNAVPVMPVPARRAPRSVAGVLAAAVATLGDARSTMYDRLYNGIEHVRALGGMRAGYATVADAGSAARFVLHGYSLVPGVRLTGAVTLSSVRFRGTVRVQAGHRLGGVLTLSPSRGVRGRLGGRSVRLGPKSAAAPHQRSVSR